MFVPLTGHHISYMVAEVNDRDISAENQKIYIRILSETGNNMREYQISSDIFDCICEIKSNFI